MASLPVRTSLADAVVSPNTPVTAANPPTNAYQEPSLAIDPRLPGHLAIAYQDGHDYPTCYLALSSDDGGTWRTIAVAGRNAMYPIPATTGPTSGNFTANFSSQCRYPTVAYGPDGTLYYLYQHGFDNEKTTADLVVSRDGGNTFVLRHPDPRYVNQYGGTWTPAMAVDKLSGTLYISWLRNDAMYLYYPARLEVTSSTDHGTTFTSPVAVDPGVRIGPLTPDMSVGPDGTLYVGWFDATRWYLEDYMASVPWALYVASSTDRGSSFAVSLVDANVTPQCCGDKTFEGDGYNRPAPSVAAGSSPGSLFITYWHKDQSGHYRAYFRGSGDGGHTSAPAKEIGAAPGRDGDERHRPAIAVANDGSLAILYYETDASKLQDTYLVSSHDSGGSFSAPLRVTDGRSDVRVAASAFFGTTFGNFVTIKFEGATLHAAWTDMRRGTTASNHQDIYSAAVVLSNADNALHPPGDVHSVTGAAVPSLPGTSLSTGAARTPQLVALLMLAALVPNGFRRRASCADPKCRDHRSSP